MIVTRLMGGLGNQMFQYAAGRALSLHLKTFVKVDTSFLEQDAKGYTPRNYELDCFEADILKVGAGELQRFLKPGPISNILSKFGFKPESNIFTETGHAFNRSFPNVPDNSFLVGYWQSEKYFKSHEQQIRSDFKLKKEKLKGAETWKERISGSYSVSLHIRRGDYVSLASANAFHGICDLSYYKRAVKYLSDKMSNLELYVFSDDLDWCRNNITFDCPVHFVDTNNQYADLYLMQHCKHNVIANSSFSWWGAWLNEHRGKVVIAPQKWFADASVDTSDVVPDSWIKL